ncbi:MAG TPA: hypothetical protein GX711_09325 [Clostridia bacterium]|nr:hypothetical protein [Clostridia bacterium]
MTDLMIKTQCLDYLDQCPCMLATIHKCPLCSLLLGQDRCDCRWPGLCLYAHYLWNKKSPGTPPLKHHQFQLETRLLEGPGKCLLYGYLAPSFLETLQKGDSLVLWREDLHQEIQTVVTEIFRQNSFAELQAEATLSPDQIPGPATLFTARPISLTPAI